MEFSAVLVLLLRGLMAVVLLAFTIFALFLLWKDLHDEDKNNTEKTHPSSK